MFTKKKQLIKSSKYFLFDTACEIFIEKKHPKSKYLSQMIRHQNEWTRYLLKKSIQISKYLSFSPYTTYHSYRGTNEYNFS